MISRPFLTSIGIAIVTAVVASAAYAQTAETKDGIQKIDPTAVERKAASALPGISSTFLIGAIGDPGLYIAYSVMKAGAIFPPHRHPDVRMTYVVSGTMYLGEGDGTNPPVAYPAGTMAMTPAGVTHSMIARDGEFAVLEIGSGPSATEMAGAD